MHSYHDLWAAVISFLYPNCVSCTGNGCLYATEANTLQNIYVHVYRFHSLSPNLLFPPCISKCHSGSVEVFIPLHYLSQRNQSRTIIWFSCLIIFSLFAGIFDRIYRSIVHLFSVLFPHAFCVWTGWEVYIKPTSSS